MKVVKFFLFCLPNGGFCNVEKLFGVLNTFLCLLIEFSNKFKIVKVLKIRIRGLKLDGKL